MKCCVSGSLDINCDYVSANNILAGKMCLTRLLEILCMYQDRGVKESRISSSCKSAYFTDLKYVSRG